MSSSSPGSDNIVLSAKSSSADSARAPSGSVLSKSTSSPGSDNIVLSPMSSAGGSSNAPSGSVWMSCPNGFSMSVVMFAPGVGMTSDSSFSIVWPTSSPSSLSIVCPASASSTELNASSGRVSSNRPGVRTFGVCDFGIASLEPSGDLPLAGFLLSPCGEFGFGGGDISSFGSVFIKSDPANDSESFVYDVRGNERRSQSAVNLPVGSTPHKPVRQILAFQSDAFCQHTLQNVAASSEPPANSTK